ncbi:hypothetical protein O1Q96_29825 [Streptomyces sp. Qhu-G9]|uniref:hypothetical protein n=1 Tax=Streptomyces sp. Qhu-G9 TaxID=3452799 RepID=UPI0022AC1E70|nr:hypothetical protein [Streptomyces aurantiacus]WAU83526.1 hypothetical protein O1Q96_29825 [Streptomyces aurantiacus]
MITLLRPDGVFHADRTDDMVIGVGVVVAPGRPAAPDLATLDTDLGGTTPVPLPPRHTGRRASSDHDGGFAG